MRIIIEKTIEGYDGVFLDVQDWFAKKEGITKHIADVIINVLTVMFGRCILAYA